ncbi:HlyD family efflux transporter periplasmic adaptor subunit [Nostoc sp. FACHB-973]|nr:HlyD family efflux transporter periplasmic adaptor subunit [Nostoc sp. FACHB-973]
MADANLPSPDASYPNREKVTNPDFLRPATPNEFLPPISNWTTIGGIVLLIIFAASIILASVLKYKITVKVSASVRPAGELRLVQAATEGMIKSIAVQVNQPVKKGDVIALVDDNRLQTQKSQLQTNIRQAKLQLSQLDAQILALDGQIAAESDRASRVIVSAKAELNRSQRDIQDKRITSIAQVREAKADFRQAQKELQKAQTHLKSAIANFKSSDASLRAAKAKRDRYQPLLQTGSISQDQFQEVQLAVEQQEQLLESQKANVEEQQQAIQQQQLAVEAATARLQSTFVNLNPSDANVAISQEKIAAESATGKVSLGKLNQEREQLLQQQVEIQKQFSRDQQELQQILRDIANTVIRASASGIIQELSLRNPSQVLRSGDIVAQISPNDSPLIIKALVPSQDIRKVKAGQEVQLRVSGCSYTEYGTLKGKVSAISPDAIASENKDKNAGNYDVTIQPEKLVLSVGDHQCTIQSGMEGRADIISSQETVLQFILRKARLLTDL